MKKTCALLLLLISPVAKPDHTYEFDKYILGISGFGYYSYSSNDNIISDKKEGVVNLSLSSDKYFITSQLSTNSYNTLRRLQLNFSTYSDDTNNIDIDIGRLTNALGLINTSSISPHLNNVNLLPLSTYDPRRYVNMPDIVDGVRLNYKRNIKNGYFSIRPIFGKQLLDNEIFDIYGDKFSFHGISNYLAGIQFKYSQDNLLLKYSYSRTNGDIDYTNPKFVLNHMDTVMNQDMHFLGMQYIRGDFKFQNELSYRVISGMSNIIGMYSMVHYNFINNWNAYCGYSYGFREGSKSQIDDKFIGISDKISNFTVALELHNTDTNNWYFNYGVPKQNTNTLITTIVYEF